MVMTDKVCVTGVERSCLSVVSFVFDCNKPFLSGDNDWLAQPGDILKLMTHLPNIVENYEVSSSEIFFRLFNEIFSDIQVPWEGWNHFDFLFAIDIDQYQNQHLVEVLKEYPIP